MDARTTKYDSDFLAPVVNFALRYPGRVLAIVLCAHLLVWTALPLLTANNLELDLAEDLALGKEWQLGYWKHPPLPWWLADLVYRLTGQVNSVYLLGPLSVIACFAGVYLLSRDIAGPLQGLIATLSLIGIHYYNYSAVKFAHDQMQLPFWVFTALFFYRALARGKTWDWLLAGAMLALAFWSKYAAFALAISLAVFLIADPLARRTLRLPGPYLMALAFCVVIAPNAIWLVKSGFLPLQYVTDRARHAQHWYQVLTYPLIWTLAQAFFIHPTLILLGVTLFPRLQKQEPPSPSVAFGRRYATMLAFGPFIVVTLAAALSGRAPITMWGYPLWSFLPLAAILWFGPVTDALRLRVFTIGIVFLFLLGPAIYIGTYIYDQHKRGRPKATEFPGHAIAEHLTREWRAKTGKELHYVAGTEFAANNVAVYSPDRPHVVVHGRPDISPWVDMNDLRKRGVLVLWEDGLTAAHVDEWRKRFQIEGEPAELEFTRQTRRPAAPVVIRYWMVPPRP
jgi:4-amino-4-deoxy-L-arabinose transferase-like glycosyltransferase